MNLVILKGRLTADPEIKSVGAKQTPKCDFTVAVNRRFEKDKADFINCEAWGNTAEFISIYFSKGKEIILNGELHIEQYEKDGEKKYATKVKVDVCEFSGGKSDGDAPAAKTKTAKVDVDFEEIDDDDDLPFV
jgi:single-strand DNA-binding protein